MVSTLVGERPGNLRSSSGGKSNKKEKQVLRGKEKKKSARSGDSQLLGRGGKVLGKKNIHCSFLGEGGSTGKNQRSEKKVVGTGGRGIDNAWSSTTIRRGQS